jgi:AraC-like DNA-binding protein
MQHSDLRLREVRATVLQFPGHGRPRIGQVAKKVGTTQRTLQRRLAAAGTSYSQLVGERRLDLITQLLKNPRVPIASVAAKAGFARHTGLCRAVNALVGMTPSEYRSLLLARRVRGTGKSKLRETSGRREKRKSTERSSRDTYRYEFKVGNKIVHSGITIDLERRETEHQRRWPNGRIKQVGYRTTAEAARKWKETR